MPTPYSDVAHLMRRAGFGATPTEISALAQLDLGVIVDQLLDVTRAPAITWPTNITDTSVQDYYRWVAHTQWWVDRMASTPAPLVEKMTLFWHMHFTSSMDKTGFQSLWNQTQNFRALGLGSFEALAQATAISPAMLDYLDNATNVKNRVNENWARESMELFTMGLNQYTQFDVTQVAKAWTGHGLSNGNYVFTATKHDTTQKTIFGITQNWDGPAVITEICSGSKKSTTARFIANKLWTFFAYESPSTTLLDALQTTFVNSNLNISALLRDIFTRSEFYSAASKQGRIRNPIEFIAAAEKYTGLTASSAHPEWYLDSLGQQPFYPPNVAGWKQNKGFISTSTMWAKGNFARNLTWPAINAGVLNGTSNLSVATAVQRTFDQFGINSPSSTTRSAMEQMVTAERTARGWAENANLLTAVMVSPEFQMA